MIAKRIFWICAVLAAIAVSARAQNVPLQAATLQSVRNEYGQVLANPQGELVQFLLVNGHVYPPGVDGQPHANNPVVFTTRIGNGVGSDPSLAGRFSAALTPRPSGTIIARVFNASTLAGASFYEDSQPFTPPSSRTIFYPVLNATTNPLDAGDSDQDGVNNSWEKSLGSNPDSGDTDGDGVSDGNELRAGTGLLNGDSYLAMGRVLPSFGGNLMAEWDAVSGKVYQLQFAVGDLASPDMVFSNVNSTVAATGTVATTVVTNGAAETMGIFRVRLVE